MIAPRTSREKLPPRVTVQAEGDYEAVGDVIDANDCTMVALDKWLKLSNFEHLRVKVSLNYNRPFLVIEPVWEAILRIG